VVKKTQERSQLLDLVLHLAEALGATNDRDVAQLARVSVDNIANWRDGSVHELKTQTLNAIKDSFALRLSCAKTTTAAMCRAPSTSVMIS
jgi:hypothetical protein